MRLRRRGLWLRLGNRKSAFSLWLGVLHPAISIIFLRMKAPILADWPFWKLGRNASGCLIHGRCRRGTARTVHASPAWLNLSAVMSIRKLIYQFCNLSVSRGFHQTGRLQSQTGGRTALFVQMGRSNALRPGTRHNGREAGFSGGRYDRSHRRS